MAKSKQTASSQATHVSTILAMTYQGLSESESRNVHQLLSSVSSMSPYPIRDVELLKQMVRHLEMFQAMLNDDIPHHEKQFVEAAISELEHAIVNKMRDVKRRLRETWEY